MHRADHQDHRTSLKHIIIKINLLGAIWLSKSNSITTLSSDESKAIWIFAQRDAFESISEAEKYSPAIGPRSGGSTELVPWLFLRKADCPSSSPKRKIWSSDYDQESSTQVLDLRKRSDAHTTVKAKRRPAAPWQTMKRSISPSEFFKIGQITF